MASAFSVASRWARKPLRSFVTDFKGNLRPMSAPNNTTLGYSVPAYLKNALFDYTKLSKDLVSKLEKLEDEQSSLVLAKKQPKDAFPLLDYKPYLTEHPRLETEGDVVREANLELVSWVSLALEQATGFKIRMGSESRRDKSRVDMIWFYVAPEKTAQDSQNWRPFAILEFKNTNMIDISGFQQAIFQEKKGVTEDEFYGLALQRASKTLIKGDNALWLTKQMVKYAKTTGVPHQVSFDFSTMLTLEFELGLEKDPDVPPKSVQVGWLREESKDGTDFQTHRAYLLGYLGYALQKTLERQEIIMK